MYLTLLSKVMNDPFLRETEGFMDNQSKKIRWYWFT